jgi:hypothetical protein
MLLFHDFMAGEGSRVADVEGDAAGFKRGSLGNPDP